MKLQHPIEIDGRTIAELHFRLPAGRDMTILADTMSKLASAGIDISSPQRMAATMNGEVFRLMILMVAITSCIGEAAGELSFLDLLDAATEAAKAFGQNPGWRGEEPTGATH